MLDSQGRCIPPRTKIVSSFLALSITIFGTVVPADARIVYTPLQVTVTNNGIIPIDLNRDLGRDFTIEVSSAPASCGQLPGFRGRVSIVPIVQTSGIVGTSGRAQLLASGVVVDGSSHFDHGDETIMTFYFCGRGYQQASGYLGLEFEMNGATHYAWVYVSAIAQLNGFQQSLQTTLRGYAYDTVPSMGIQTGQILGPIQVGRSKPYQFTQSSIEAL